MKDVISDLKTFNLNDIKVLSRYYKIDSDKPYIEILNDIAKNISESSSRTHKPGFRSVKGNINTVKDELIALFTPYKPENANKILEILNGMSTNDINQREANLMYSKLTDYGLKLKRNFTDTEVSIFNKLLEKWRMETFMYLIKKLDYKEENVKILIDLLVKFKYDLSDTTYSLYNQNILFIIHNPTTVEYLIRQGVNINHKNNAGKTVLCNNINDIIHKLDSKDFAQYHAKYKELLKVYFKYSDYKKICYIPGQGTNYFILNVFLSKRKFVLDLFKQVHDEKLELLKEVLNTSLESLDIVAPDDKDTILENLDDIEKKYPEPVPIKREKYITIIDFDNVKLKYDHDKQVLEEKIKYLHDTIDLYPKGRTFTKLEKKYKEHPYFREIKESF